MTRYATDANVIFASLISGKENYERMFSDNKFFVPDFALAEIQKYQPEILRKTKLTFEELKAYTLGIFDRLTVVPNLVVSTQSYLQAFHFCRDIDEKTPPTWLWPLSLGLIYLPTTLNLSRVYVGKTTQKSLP